ncbi:unnamed protein product [Rangifer tarandus platyrhynchus]|uniref:Uncharacterized protein n=2 Tax=Rangifer tarandus platyrhynchus TaxID=3082113 RepID=A0ACB0EIC5_RANTA|nr:unnamed protein product [Rangifer tarandus platyrhynchus]CAI9700318.1 unnamed protein product [Rangifer tarandus platyrhynchus]
MLVLWECLRKLALSTKDLKGKKGAVQRKPRPPELFRDEPAGTGGPLRPSPRPTGSPRPPRQRAPSNPRAGRVSAPESEDPASPPKEGAAALRPGPPPGPAPGPDPPPAPARVLVRAACGATAAPDQRDSGLGRGAGTHAQRRGLRVLGGAWRGRGLRSGGGDSGPGRGGAGAGTQVRGGTPTRGRGSGSWAGWGGLSPSRLLGGPAATLLLPPSRFPPPPPRASGECGAPPAESGVECTERAARGSRPGEGDGAARARKRQGWGLQVRSAGPGRERGAPHGSERGRGAVAQAALRLAPLARRGSESARVGPAPPAFKGPQALR